MDNLDKRKRAANITNEQRTLLTEYMTKHPKLTKGKFSSQFTLKDSIHLWNEITEILNSVNGAKKDWKGWRKCWHDFQSRSKKKHGVIMKSMAATGGGTQNTEVLTPQEEQVLDIMCSTSINGHPDVQESTVNLLEDADDDIMEVEYLNEYEENDISNIHDYTSNSNNNNSLAPQKRNAILGNENNDFKKLLSEKENINYIKDSNIHIEQASAKCTKGLTEIRNSLKDVNSYVQEAEDEERSNTNSGTGKKISKKELKNTIEISTKLNNIYEKTYELKKSYYKAKIEYLRRFVEAHEKLASVIGKRDI